MENPPPSSGIWCHSLPPSTQGRKESTRLTNGLRQVVSEILDKSHLYTFLTPWTWQDHTGAIPTELRLEGEGDL